MTPDDDLGEKLDRVAAILSIAFADRIAEESARVRSEPVARALLDLTDGDWVSSKDLQQSVAASCGVTDRTVRTRLSELSRLGVLRSRSSGRSVEYKNSQVI